MQIVPVLAGAAVVVAAAAAVGQIKMTVEIVGKSAMVVGVGAKEVSG